MSEDSAVHETSGKDAADAAEASADPKTWAPRLDLARRRSLLTLAPESESDPERLAVSSSDLGAPVIAAPETLVRGDPAMLAASWYTPREKKICGKRKKITIEIRVHRYFTQFTRTLFLSLNSLIG